MRTSKTLILLCCLLAVPAAARDPNYRLKHGQRYVHTHMETTATPFRLYNQKGETILQLDARGLSYRGERLCHWQGLSPQSGGEDVVDLETWDSKKGFGDIYLDAGCPRDLPIIVEAGDNGLGGAAVFLHYNLKRDGRYETVFRGEALHFLRSELPPEDAEEYLYDSNALGC